MLYDQIIVPFDGSEPARAASQIGADLSTLFGAPLLLVSGARTDQPHDVSLLKERAMRMSTAAVEVWVETERTPGRAVASASAHRPNALVVMSSHARTGVRRALFGSIAEEVLRTVDTPVLALGPACALRDPVDLRQVVLCVDGSDTSQAALSLAASWARALRLRCLLLNVHIPAHKDKGLGTFDFDPLIASLRGVSDDIEGHVVEAPTVAEGITLVTKRTAASVVVMATHGRTGVNRFRHGSITADVVRESPVPVLVQHGAATHGVEWLQQVGPIDSIDTGSTS